MPDASTTVTFAGVIKDYGPAVAWIVALIGWGVSSSQANRREVRKEVRSEIDDITKVGKEILSELSAYYRTDVGSEAGEQHEMVIKAKFKEIDLRFDRLHSRPLDSFPTGGSHAALSARESFFDLATLNHFETSSRPTSVERRLLVLRQTHACLALTEALHSQFLSEFK